MPDPSGRNVHECVGCPHLASQHLLKAGAPIDGPYICRHCGHAMMRDDATRLITYADAVRLHGQEFL
jgi:hypothetical protein